MAGSPAVCRPRSADLTRAGRPSTIDAFQGVRMMNKTILFGMTAIALGAGVTGCTNERANTAQPPVADNGNAPGTALEDSVDLVELPAMQADLIAKSGSDTVYFTTDASLLDDSARATLAAQARWMLANTKVRASI